MVVQQGTRQSGILPQMVKFTGSVFAITLLSLVQVSAEGCAPQAWNDAELVLVSKKGDISSSDNWRRIALPDVIG